MPRHKLRGIFNTNTMTRLQILQNELSRLNTEVLTDTGFVLRNKLSRITLITAVLARELLGNGSSGGGAPVDATLLNAKFDKSNVLGVQWLTNHELTPEQLSGKVFDALIVKGLSDANISAINQKMDASVLAMGLEQLAEEPTEDLVDGRRYFNTIAQKVFSCRETEMGSGVFVWYQAADAVYLTDRGYSDIFNPPSLDFVINEVQFMGFINDVFNPLRFFTNRFAQLSGGFKQLSGTYAFPVGVGTYPFDIDLPQKFIATTRSTIAITFSGDAGTQVTFTLDAGDMLLPLTDNIGKVVDYVKVPAKYTKGTFQMPSMTTAQINAITNPVVGMEVFNTTLNVKVFRDATSWQRVNSAAM